MATKKIKVDAVIEALNRILELELAGVVRYTHYALMSSGFARIPITSWYRENAGESLEHARRAGEQITSLGGHPSLKVGKIPTAHRHDVVDMLEEAHRHELEAVAAYTRLLDLVEDRNVPLEEYARGQIVIESEDVNEIEKMLRRPGS